MYQFVRRLETWLRHWKGYESKEDEDENTVTRDWR